MCLATPSLASKARTPAKTRFACGKVLFSNRWSAYAPPKGCLTKGGDMIRLSVTLIVAIYIILVVIPEPDHGAGTATDGPRESGGQNWLVALITDAEEAASAPRRGQPAARGVQPDPMDRLIEYGDGLALMRADGEMIEITAVIDPAALWAAAPGAQAVASVSVVEQAPGATEIGENAVAEAAPQVTQAIWRVAADSVNFRAGPSTDTAVLTALTRGEEVVVLADAADDWAHLRVVASGLEGYMAARFIEQVN